jgi:hypothetical protein
MKQCAGVGVRHHKAPVLALPSQPRKGLLELVQYLLPESVTPRQSVVTQPGAIFDTLKTDMKLHHILKTMLRNRNSGAVSPADEIAGWAS